MHKWVTAQLFNGTLYVATLINGVIFTFMNAQLILRILELTHHSVRFVLMFSLYNEKSVLKSCATKTRQNKKWDIKAYLF